MWVRPASISVRSSILDEGELGAWAAETYGLSGSERTVIVSSAINDTYRIGGGPDARYLRLSRPALRRPEEVDAELALLRHLRERDLPVVQAVARRDGDLVGRIAAPEGERAAVLFEAVPGEGARDLTTTQARAFGRLAAEVHAAADTGFAAPRFSLDADHLLDRPLAAIRTRMADYPAELAELQPIVDRVRSRLAMLPRTAPDWGVCHADLHPGNVRFVGDRPTIFDFDCWGYGWRAYDLTVFLWNTYGEGRPKSWREARWRAFRRGYAEVRPLPEGLDELVPSFLVARQLWLAGYDCAGLCGWPPQWVHDGWLRSLLGQLQVWRAEFAAALA
jgi:Ser/Thr protein kinase RdoA (MazF antagonist)